MAVNLKPINVATQPLNPYINPGNLPNLTRMTGSATNIIRRELEGLPDPTETRTANAAWGAGAGLAPGTPFLENRGRRLYNSEIEGRQRQGIQDLLNFLRGYSGTVSATPGQLLGYSQNQQRQNFEDAMAQREMDFAQRRLQQENAAEIPHSYVTSGAGVGGGPGLFQGYNFSRDRFGNMFQR